MQVFNEIVNYSYQNNIGLCHLTNEFFALVVKRMFDEIDNGILIVTASSYEANKIYNFVNNYVDALLFQADDIIGSSVVSSSLETSVDRQNVLANLVSSSKKVVVTDIQGYLKPLVSRDSYVCRKLILSVNKSISRNEIIASLEEFGYQFDSIVTKTGEVGVRGFVLDVFPINEDDPVRIEFFGDEIEKIRYFRCDDQKTYSSIDEIVIHPVIDAKVDDEKFNIISYFDKEPLVVFKDYEQIRIANERIVMERFDTDGSGDFLDFYAISPNFVNYYFDFDSNYSDMHLANVYCYDVKPILPFHSDISLINKFLNECLGLGKTVIIALSTKNVSNFVQQLEVGAILTNENEVFKGRVNVIQKSMLNGFACGEFVFITEFELFNRRSVKRKTSNYKYSTVIKDISKLDIGDFVVHNLYGIGIYNGMKVLKKNGILGDYIEVLYAKGDKLYIPASKIELLSKYSGGDGYVPKINALNSSSWFKTKAKVKEKIRYEAERLLKVQAERELQKGFAFSKDSPMQVMFESEFMYEETKDQLLVTGQIKGDMEKASPMDRILCGDVGYGKTEVAFRCMFKAVLDGKQVFYLCPTTLLSRQQYESALDRFKNYPVNIALINRFTSKGDVHKIIQGLKDGSIDILFGTHRLLSNDLVPKDLGLLVVDEEQRFGVAHKEKIKEFKSTIDVLTLTATPIPRTLQMAILGLKNLSIIETPPKNRKSIQTYIVLEEDKVIRDVIYRELSRGGQTFILYNRVEDIEVFTARIRRLVPDARVIFAHGKMDKSKLEDTMDSFVNGEYDILVCTTIIETGVDIPNANTLIVIDADKFGLSQLYQIRGRVGRSDRLAYAYLTCKAGRVLTETAVKRLKVLKDYTELGSGFAIANRDLSIRGAGDILGSEQAGFIDTVGIDLYMKMLNDEIRRLKGEEILDDSESDIYNVDVSNHIKDTYVSDEDIKIQIHKLINSICDYASYISVRNEIIDRFGKIDDDMELYMQQQLFESYVKTKGIISVTDNDRYVELVFNENVSNSLSYEDLFTKSIKISKKFDFSYRNKKLFIKMVKSSDKHPIYYFNELLKEF